MTRPEIDPGHHHYQLTREEVETTMNILAVKPSVGLPRSWGMWQLQGQDEWVFGIPVRGLIRTKIAEIYFDEEQGGWIWFVRGAPAYDSITERGKAPTLSMAVELAEKALGVEPGP
jgi:hypothetical protein